MAIGCGTRCVDEADMYDSKLYDSNMNNNSAICVLFLFRGCNFAGGEEYF